MNQEITVEELKKIQIQVLDEFVEYCSDNNLIYYLSFGTLLGAVRHQGYIPWDDDIDVMMPRPDYEKFISSYNKSNSLNYKLVTTEIDNAYPIAYAKLYDCRTIIQENVNASYTLGVNIDIFPIDALPDSITDSTKLFHKILSWRKISDIKLSRIAINKFNVKQICLKIFQFFLKLISYKFINRHIDKLSKKYDYTKSKYGYVIVYPPKQVKRFTLDMLGQPQKLLFEGKLYNVPSDYSQCLTVIFGDYMKLPPIEQRVAHHSFSAFYK